MSYSGTVASEHSSGDRIRRGGITKTGNAHLRRIVIEAAWAYRHRPAGGRALLKRQQPVSEEVKAIAWKAQHRLHARYRTLTARGKSKQQVVTAVGRELLISRKIKNSFLLLVSSPARAILWRRAPQDLLTIAYVAGPAISWRDRGVSTAS